MIAKWLEVEMPFIWELGFPLAVWVIYTSDHLLDAWILKEKCVAPRHLFHYQYFTPIFLIWLLGSFVCIFLLPFWMPPIFLYFGLIMGGISCLHFLLVKFIQNEQSIFFLKEWGVGSIYFLGVAIPPFLLKLQFYQTLFPGTYLTIQQIFMDLGIEKMVFLCIFFDLIMMNILLFAYFEAEQDAQEEQSSWTQAIGKQSTKNLIFGLGIFNLLLLFSLSFYDISSIRTFIVLGLMNIFMLIPLLFPNYWVQKERYRTLGDTLFLLPFWAS